MVSKPWVLMMKIQQSIDGCASQEHPRAACVTDQLIAEWVTTFAVAITLPAGGLPGRVQLRRDDRFCVQVSVEFACSKGGELLLDLDQGVAFVIQDGKPLCGCPSLTCFLKTKEKGLVL